eukprot:GHVU01051439.1.p1 GENE.GHVU01051439.1~~GHVU01051439.1.p1  ORF type:complete len:140 (-),score=17.49 GHVU01051439.1:241-660(-)
MTYGGATPGVAAGTVDTEKYDGTSWTEVNDLATGRKEASGAGTQTSSLMVSGYNTGFINSVEEYNGTNWSEIAEVNAARVQAASAGLTSTAGLIISGYVAPAGSVNTESWNGSTWTEVNNVATARWDGSAGGSSSSALF